jgi:hypothetical protein
LVAISGWQHITKLPRAESIGDFNWPPMINAVSDKRVLVCFSITALFSFRTTLNPKPREKSHKRTQITSPQQNKPANEEDAGDAY